MDVFQGGMFEMFQGLKYIHAYLDNPLLFTYIDSTDHLTNLEQLFIKLQGNVLKCNIEKSNFWSIRNRVFRFMGYPQRCNINRK